MEYVIERVLISGSVVCRLYKTNPEIWFLIARKKAGHWRSLPTPKTRCPRLYIPKGRFRELESDMEIDPNTESCRVCRVYEEITEIQARMILYSSQS